MQGICYCDILYPGFLSLPEKDAYLFTYKDKRVMVGIQDHIEALKILDFDNRLVKNTSGGFALHESINEISDKNIRVEYQMAPAGTPRQFLIEDERQKIRAFTTQFYTELMFAYEILNPDNVTKEEEEFIGAVLEEFLHSYKFIATDSRVRLQNDIGYDRIFERRATIRYSKEDHEISLDVRLLQPRQLTLRIKAFKALEPRESVPDTKEKIVRNGEQLGSFLYEGRKVPEEHRLLAKAFEELDVNRNAKFALLESFVVAESTISKTLYNIKMNAGVSKNKLDEYDAEIGISYKINVELPAFLSNITSHERQILGEIDRVRKLRNDVMHKGKSVREDEALASINAATKLLYMLMRRNLI